MSESKTSKRRIEAVEKQAQALEMRINGDSFDTIARKLGYAGTPGAYKAVQSALMKTIQEPADELRVIEAARLDMASLAIYEKVKAGDLLSIDRWVAISARRSKLMGLDAPVKQEVTGKDGGALIVQAWSDILDSLVKPAKSGHPQQVEE